MCNDLMMIVFSTLFNDKTQTRVKCKLHIKIWKFKYS